MNLNECRQEIDKINDEILQLFLKRMEISTLVADYKRENNLPIMQPEREREILDNIAKKAGDELSSYATTLFSDIMTLSRAYQSERNFREESSVVADIKEALSQTPQEFPKEAVVACQGVRGAYSQLAANRIFEKPQILYFKNFDAVFSAIEQGLCRYGILPIENSLHGSVNQVYDLMKNHNFYITKGIKLKINHVLLAKRNMDLSKITDIYSHEQAIGQCSDFLKNHPEIKVHICENTAVAASIVANNESNTIASISSPECAEIYGLCEICNHIANADNNYTRFICISKKAEIYPNSDKISLMLHVEHKPGALYSFISRFASLGLNITKLESRPIAGSEFEYLFYFDIEAPITSPKVMSLIGEICKDNPNSVFLGSYSEI